MKASCEEIYDEAQDAYRFQQRVEHIGNWIQPAFFGIIFLVCFLVFRAFHWINWP